MMPAGTSTKPSGMTGRGAIQVGDGNLQINTF
jgi:hypothetical protein